MPLIFLSKSLLVNVSIEKSNRLNYQKIRREAELEAIRKQEFAKNFSLYVNILQKNHYLNYLISLEKLANQMYWHKIIKLKLKKARIKQGCKLFKRKSHSKSEQPQAKQEESKERNSLKNNPFLFFKPAPTGNRVNLSNRPTPLP